MARVSIFQSQIGKSVHQDDLEENTTESAKESVADSNQYIITHDNES